MTGPQANAAPATVSVRFDEDLAAWLIGQAPMGPAGAASVELPGGVTFSVDAADPHRIVEIVVPAEDWDAQRPPSAEALAVVATLVSAGASLLLSRAAARVGTHEVVLDEGQAIQRRLVSRLALLDDLSADLPSPWWAAEACLLCARADPTLGLAERSKREAQEGARAMIDETVTVLSALPLDALSQAADAVTASIEVDDEATAARLREAMSSWRQGRQHALSPDEVARRFAQMFEDRIVPEPDLAPSAAVFRGSGDVVEGLCFIGRSVLDDDRIRPGLVSIPSTGRVVWNKSRRSRSKTLRGGGELLLQPSEMVVRIRIHPDVPEEAIGNVWVRVFTLSPPSLVATAPLRRQEDERTLGVARLAVPSGLTLGELAVDVTDVPTLPPDGGQTMAVRTAIAYARAAGGSERLERWSSASLAWEHSAKAWLEAQDERREGAARLYAAEDARRAGMNERADHQSRSARISGIDLRLGPDSGREIPDPFLAEAVVPDSWVL